MHGLRELLQVLDDVIRRTYACGLQIIKVHLDCGIRALGGDFIENIEVVHLHERITKRVARDDAAIREQLVSCQTVVCDDSRHLICIYRDVNEGEGEPMTLSTLSQLAV